MWSQYIPDGVGRSEKTRLRKKRTRMNRNERQRERNWSVGRNLNKIKYVSSNLR